MYPIVSFLIFIVTYTLSSLFALAGLGASNTLIPIYYSLGVPFSIAAASGLLLNVFSLSSATINNGRHHYINWKIGTILLIPAVIMAPIGAIVETSMPKKYILIIFTIFLIYTIYNLLKKRKVNKRNQMVGKHKLPISIAVGSFSGFLAGLLGIGGGMIILPVLTFLESDYKKVSGTAAYAALFSSASGFLSYQRILGGVNYALWVIIISAGIIGGLTGSMLMNRFKSKTIRYIIISIISVVALRLIYSIVL